jgi:A/G-specific adenine glycosylase
MTHVASFHAFSPAEIADCRRELVAWFRANGRELPWRSGRAERTEREQFWMSLLSEIMSQQTRLATVLPFFARWLEKWPSLDAFAAASEEEVLAMWQGLGYYRRAKNLHAAAKMIVGELQGVLPRTVAELEALPGVGPYTAGAIASVFNVSAAIVDGNVTRVLCRLRTINAPPNKANALVWRLARELVPRDAADVYDFNQGLMDLGATICTPKAPKCDACPLRANCFAFRRATAPPVATAAPPTDIEDVCKVCVGDAAELAVTAFPAKAAKTKQRVELIAVAILHLPGSDEFVLLQRPSTGILSDMWEFVQVVVPEADDRRAAVDAVLRQRCGIDANSSAVVARRHVGSVQHELTHVKQTFFVEHLVLRENVVLADGCRLFSRASLTQSAVSQGNLKCLALVDEPAPSSRKRSKSAAAAAATDEATTATGSTASTADSSRRAKRRNTPKV